MNVRGVGAIHGFVSARSGAAWGVVFLVASLGGAAAPAQGGVPLIAISITGGSPQTICDTDNGSQCVTATESDLLLCKPITFGLNGEITGCRWRLLFDGVDTTDANQIDQQMRALSVAPDGSLVFVVAATDTVPGGLTLKNNDITVFSPTNPLKPYTGGGPFVTADGAFKKYLDGVLTQADPSAKPWDALDLIYQGGCEKFVNANLDLPRTCPIIGSLTAGSGVATNFGRKFNNEDMIRCTPTGWAGNGSVESCQYAVMLDASAITIGGVPNGITSDIEAIDIVSFDPVTMQSQMVFMKKSGSPPDFPLSEAGRDLLVYAGRLGSGLCVPGNKPCAGNVDCPMGETCNTGSCLTGGAPCETDQDCGSGNSCVYGDPAAYSAQITLYFDGSAVGLTTNSQKLEAFAIIPDSDGDNIPDGLDNCPNNANAPGNCSGAGAETCPSGLDSECPTGESCVPTGVQADTDGDGVGDACDQCNGRPDPGTCAACPGSPCPAICAGSASSACACGDGIEDFPSEQCDLGSQNGQPGSPCSATCTISGKCKPSGGVCTTAANCPSGEGCCGNNIVEANEACDDGNLVEDDVCTSDCEANLGGTPILGCEDLTGPNVLPAALKVTKFTDTSDAPNIDRWKTKGEAIFAPGLTIDPDSENVRIIYNNTPSGLLFSSTLAPANCAPAPTCFVQKDPKLKWKFKNTDANVPGSPGWRKGKFKVKSNLIKFSNDGRKTTLFTAADALAGLRQTIRVGDVCMTTVITCVQKGASFKCTVPTLP